MKKVVALFLVIIIAICIGGAFGIVHDQVTYSISEEYYTKFKFIQFHLGRNIGTGKAPEVIFLKPRLGVAFVGFLASWWVGLLIGLILGITNLFYKDNKQELKILLKAVLINVATVFIFGIIGFFVGTFIFTDLNSGFWIPDNVVDPKHFSVVGWIHNFGYLGGLIGLMIALFYNHAQRLREG